MAAIHEGGFGPFMEEELDTQPLPDFGFEASSPTMKTVDLGPDAGSAGTNLEERKGKLGPTTPEEAEVLEDANNPIYIYRGPIYEDHCMDDRVTKLGLQLPGGLFQTRLASHLMNADKPAIPVSDLSTRIAHTLQGKGLLSFAHGGCGAGTFKRIGLLEIAYNEGAAADFTYEVMENLKVSCKDNEVIKAITCAGERASDAALWDWDFNQELKYVQGQPGIAYEEFPTGHRAAGLRVDTSGYLFDNGQFRKDHSIDGEEVGLLSVSLGAYRDLMLKDETPADRIRQELTHAALFTYGMAKALGHPYMPAAIISADRYQESP